MKQLRILFLCLPFFFFHNCTVLGQCRDNEQKALLELKKGFSNFFYQADIATWTQEIDCCRWKGVVCNNDTENVVSLSISSSDISGPLPSCISELTNLVYLDMSANDLVGDIRSLQNLTNLTYLDLSNNKFTGNISFIDNLTRLRTLDISNNGFSGPISQMENHKDILTIDMSHNNFIGSIPNWIFQLKNLESLNLQVNNFSGKLGVQHFGNLQNLTRLDLSQNKLILVNTSSNITLQKINDIGLGNCGLNEFPQFLKNAKLLSYLDLSKNKITGKIPNWIWNAMDSSHFISSYLLDLSSNNLSGLLSEIPSAILQKARILSLANNNLYGEIPETICNDSKLMSLDLSKNKFNGRIPECMGEMMSNLIILRLQDNNFDGRIPQNHQIYCQLRTLNLNGNKLNGDIPRFLKNCSDLQMLDLGRNQLRDTFPFWLESLPSLRVLVLSSNRFYDRIDFTNVNCSFPSLQVIHISSNNFKGNIPLKCLQGFKTPRENDNTTQIIEISLPQITAISYQDGPELVSYKYFPGSYFPDSRETMTTKVKGIPTYLEKIFIGFYSIDFSNNSLEGEILEEIGELTSLVQLDLSGNLLTGSIPKSIGNLTKLEWLDLSINQLSGKIPPELRLLTFLSMLNVSMNNLEGRIPQGKQFSTFSEASFLGNLKLCGPPLLNNCDEDSPSSTSPWKVSSPSFIETILFWLMFIISFVPALIVGVLVGNLVPIQMPKAHVKRR